MFELALFPDFMLQMFHNLSFRNSVQSSFVYWRIGFFYFSFCLHVYFFYVHHRFLSVKLLFTHFHIFTPFLQCIGTFSYFHLSTDIESLLLNQEHSHLTACIKNTIWLGKKLSVAFLHMLPVL